MKTILISAALVLLGTSLFALSFSPTPAAPGAEAAPSDNCLLTPFGIMGWWRGDDNAHDSIFGNNSEPNFGNHGVYSGTGSPHFVEGKVDAAFNFNGVDDVVTVAQNGNLDLGGDLSWEAWVYWQGNINPTVLEAILVKMGPYESPGVVAFGMSINDANDSLVGVLDGKTFSSPGGVIPLNTWFHVAQTYDLATNTARVYLNGDEVASLVMERMMSFGDLHFGNRPGKAQYFHGHIDEVEIYRTVLSAAEIKSIYSAGALGRCKGTAKLEVQKQFIGGSGPGVAIAVDGTTRIFGVTWDTTTGELDTWAGKHQVTEHLWNRPLSDYTTTIVCYQGHSDLVAASNGKGPLIVNLVDGADVVCVFTNIKNPASCADLEVHPLALVSPAVFEKLNLPNPSPVEQVLPPEVSREVQRLGPPVVQLMALRDFIGAARVACPAYTSSNRR